MLRELTTDDGAFAASQDADTEGDEGATFIWTAAEIREVLGDDAAAVRGRVRRDRRRQLGGRDDPVAGLADATSSPTRDGRRAARSRAGRRRARGSWRAARRGRSRRATTRRSRPGTGWRSRRSPTRAALLGATRRATSAAAVRRRRGRSSAGCSAPDGALGRSWKDGRAVGQGVLEDYAHLADGLLALYEATFDERWFATARDADGPRSSTRFADPAGGFFDTADDHERLVTRPKDLAGQRRRRRATRWRRPCCCGSRR